MRTFVLGILLIFFDLIGVGQGNYPPSYYIPSGGSSSTVSPYGLPGTIYTIGTIGAVNLGSNTYTLTYSSLPNANTSWFFAFYADSLTVSTPSNVNIFGVTPLSDYPGQRQFFYEITVTWNYWGVPIKHVHSFASLSDLKNLNTRTTFNAPAQFNDSAYFYGSFQLAPPVGGSTPAPNKGVIALDDSGHLGYSTCTPWCTQGNVSSPYKVVLGTTDTGAVNIIADNLAAGIISPVKFNTAWGFLSLSQNTSGTGNTAIGYAALQENTTGSNNVTIGGSENSTTGGYNAVVGEGAAGSLTTGSYNTILGTTSDVATASTHNAVAIGYNAVASTNQLTVAGVENIYLPGTNSGLRYVLQDTSGTGNFVPVKPFGNTGTYTTPVTGDSITISTNKNTVNPAGTLANLTIIFPANPIPYQSYFFNFQQAITALHYSIRLSGGANPTGLPSSESQYGTFSAYWEPNFSTWVAGSH